VDFSAVIAWQVPCLDQQRRRFKFAERVVTKIVKLKSLALLSVVVSALFVCSANASAQSVTLAWDPSPSPEVTGYTVYYGTTSGVYPSSSRLGNQTTATIAGLQAGLTYFFVATASDASGMESLPSNEVSYQVPPSSLPPVVALTAPVAGASYTAPASIGLAASVTANGHAITSVQYYNGGTLVGEVAAAPYDFTWNNVGADGYSLTARAIYDSGSTVDSLPVNITVANVPLPPVVALTAPVAGASYTVPASIGLAANVAANGHTITSVQYYNGSTLVGEVASAPYNFTWNNVGAGSYGLSARAIYDSGSAVDSLPVNVTVANALPTVALTTPVSGASYAAPASIGLTASVSANGHSVTSVQYYNGSTLLGEVASMPYNFTWNDVGEGSYTLSALAIYDSGSTVASAPVNLTVTSLPAPWQTADIGSVVAGSAGESGGLFTVQGAGTLSGTADKFRFVYQPLSGNGEIKVRLNLLGQTGVGARIGVMIRESLTSGSKFVFMGMSPEGTFRWLRRSSTGGTTSSSTSKTGTPPNTWVRLLRSGTTITGYKSLDGATWTKVNSVNLTMATNISFGLVVASGSTNALNTSTFSIGSVVP
jgi:hypothetical protein